MPSTTTTSATTTKRTLAQLLLDAAKAAVNAQNTLDLRMRTVYNLVVKEGFTLEVNSKLPSFRDTLDTYSKNGNADILEVYAMVQEQVRLKVEGKTDEKKTQAGAILARLQSQWRNVLNTEQKNMRKAQGIAAKAAGQAKREEVSKAAHAIEQFLTLDPASLSPELQRRQTMIQEVFAFLDAADDEAILAVRARTFDVMFERRKDAATAEPAEPVKLTKATAEPAA
jgi:hypothetical protein